jgi:serine/threonine-protein kinase
MNLEAVAALCQRISSVGIAPTALIVTHTKQRGGLFLRSGQRPTLVAHHVPNSSELVLFMEFLVWGLARWCFFWVLYIALEPYVRRRWPATLVSWSRLLAGGFRDRLVGRDVLIGCLFGVFLTLLSRVAWFVPAWLGEPPTQPLSGPQLQFLRARPIIASILGGVFISLFAALAFLFVLFLFRALLRKDWAAAVAFVLLTSFSIGSPGLFAGGSQSTTAAVVNGLTLMIYNGAAVFLIIRFGLLAEGATFFFQLFLLENFPLTTQASAWYAEISLAGILLITRGPAGFRRRRA